MSGVNKKKWKSLTAAVVLAVGFLGAPQGAWAAVQATALSGTGANTGSATASQDRATAVGGGAYATDSESTALGTDATAKMQSALAIGFRSLVGQGGSSSGTAGGIGGIAIGSAVITEDPDDPGWYLTTTEPAKVTADYGIALGSASSVSAQNSLALGYGSSATAANAVALGQGSVANTANTISVGSSSNTRKIVNVTAGSNTTDAANYGQLVKNTTYTASNGSVTIQNNADGTAFTINGLGSGSGSGIVDYDDTNYKWLSTDFGETGVTHGSKSTAYGYGANASKPYATAIGNNASASSTASVAIGYNATSSNSGVAIGNYASSSGSRAIAISGGNANSTYAATASGEDSIALGVTANSTGSDAIAVGYGSKSYTNYSLALGGATVGTSDSVSSGGTYGIAVGNTANVTADKSVALGYGASATAENAVALGQGSVANTENTISVGSSSNTRKIVNVTAGSNTTDAANYGQLVKNTTYTASNGSVTIQNNADGTAFTINGLGSGSGSGIVDYDTNYATSKKYWLSTDFGATGVTHGDESTAYGYTANASGLKSTALGFGSKAYADQTVAIGGATVGKSVGNNAGIYGIAIGLSASVTESASIAIGWEASASKVTSVALGWKSSAEALNSVALGSLSNVDTEYTVSVGSSKKVGGFTRKIVNVTAGSADTDAATYGQLVDAQAVTTEDGGSATTTYTPYEADSNGLVTVKTNDGGTAFTFKTAAATSSLVIGNETKHWVDLSWNGAADSTSVTRGENSTAYGYLANASAAESMAIGYTAKAYGENAIALGSSSNAYTAYSYAAGNGATVGTAGASDSGGLAGIAIGNGVPSTGTTGSDGSATLEVRPGAKVTGDFGIALGTSSSVTNEKSVALGYGSSATAANAVALGQGSVADIANTISVGSSDETSGFTRKIVNVTAGTNATDAANYGQLVKNTTYTASNGSVTIQNNADGTAFTINGLGSGSGSGIVDYDADYATSKNYWLSTDFGKTGVTHGANSTAYGYGANASADNSVALGSGASATAANAVALGQGSVANTANTISVGSSTSTRKIVNVTAGSSTNDAANYGQLVKNTTYTASNGSVTIQNNADGTAFTIDGLGTEYTEGDHITIDKNNKNRISVTTGAVIKENNSGIATGGNVWNKVSTKNETFTVDSKTNTVTVQTNDGTDAFTIKLNEQKNYTGAGYVNVSDDNVITVTADGKVRAKDTGLITGEKVYGETREEIKSENWIAKGNTAGKNLSILDEKIGKLEDREYDYIDADETVFKNLQSLNDAIVDNSKLISYDSANGGTVKIGPSVTAGNVEMGGRTVTGVKAGTQSGEAAIWDQLAAANQTLYADSELRSGSTTQRNNVIYDNAGNALATLSLGDYQKDSNGFASAGTVWANDVAVDTYLVEYTNAGKDGNDEIGVGSVVVKKNDGTTAFTIGNIKTKVTKDEIQELATDYLGDSKTIDVTKSADNTTAVISVKKGSVTAGSLGVIDGDTAYSELRPMTGTYVSKEWTTAKNLESLSRGIVDKTVNGEEYKINASQRTVSILNNDGTKAFDLTVEASALGAYTAGKSITISDSGIISAVTGDVSLSNTDLVTGAKVYQAVQNSYLDGNTYTLDKNNKSVTVKHRDNTDAFTLTVDSLGADYTAGKNVTISDKNVISVDATGEVETGNEGIVTGGTVYNETRGITSKNYIGNGNTAGKNLSLLDEKIGETEDGTYINADETIAASLKNLDTAIVDNNKLIRYNSADDVIEVGADVAGAEVRMGSRKLTGVTAGNASGEAATYDQIAAANQQLWAVSETRADNANLNKNTIYDNQGQAIATLNIGTVGEGSKGFVSGGQVYANDVAKATYNVVYKDAGVDGNDNIGIGTVEVKKNDGTTAFTIGNIKTKVTQEEIQKLATDYIGDSQTIDVTKSKDGTTATITTLKGEVTNSDNGLGVITGKIAYAELRPEEGVTYNYIATNNTTAKNLAALDAAVAGNKLDNATYTVTEKGVDVKYADKETTAFTLKVNAADLGKYEEGSNISIADGKISAVTGEISETDTKLATGAKVYEAVQKSYVNGENYKLSKANNKSVTVKNKDNSDAFSLTLDDDLFDDIYTAGDDISIDDNNVISVKKDGKVAAGNMGIVTGQTVYSYVTPTTGHYVDSTLSAAQNFTKLDTAVYENSLDGKTYTIKGDTRSVDVMTKGGEKAFTIEVAKEALGQYEAGDHITISTDGKISANVGEISSKAAANELVTGKMVYDYVTPENGTYVKSNLTAAQNFKELDTAVVNKTLNGATYTYDKENKQFKVLNNDKTTAFTLDMTGVGGDVYTEGTNISIADGKISAVTGDITADADTLVTGKTVYSKLGALDSDASYKAISANNDIAANLAALDKALSEAGISGGNTVEDGSSATGSGNTVSGKGSTTTGTGNTVDGTGSSATGNKNNVTGSESTATGDTNTVDGNKSSAIGDKNNVKGDESTAVGKDNNVNGDASTANGKGNIIGTNETPADNSSATGNRNEIYSGGSTAMGDKNIINKDAEGSKATGTGNIIGGTTSDEGTGKGSTATGNDNKVYGEGSTAIGDKNVINKDATGSTAMGTGNIIGDAAGEKGTGAGSTASGKSNEVYGEGSSAGGLNNIVSGNGSTAFGNGNNVSGNSSSASGLSNIVSGDGATAIGNGNEVTGKDAVAEGLKNLVSGEGSVASGSNNNVSGAGSVAGGIGNTVSGIGSGAYGSNNNISGADTFVLGRDITSSAQNSVILGAGSSTKSEGFTVDRNNVVSVGSAGSERQIINVAAGTQNTDAVNYGQIIAYNTYSPDPKTGQIAVMTNDNKVAFYLDGIGSGTYDGVVYSGSDTITIGEDRKISVNTNGKVASGNSGIVTGDTVYQSIVKNDEYKVSDDGKVEIKTNAGSTAFTITGIGTGAAALGDTTKLSQAGLGDTVTDSILSVNDKVGTLSNDINKVGAGAAALAALHPEAYDPNDKWSFAVGYGHYKGANAGALGAFFKPNVDTTLSVASTVGNGDSMVNMGVSFKLGNKGKKAGTYRSAVDLVDRIDALEVKMAREIQRNDSQDSIIELQTKALLELKADVARLQQQIANLLSDAGMVIR